MAIELDNKVDIAGLIGLVIALATAGYQLKGYFQGARVVLFAPAQMLIRRVEYPGSEPHVRFATEATYANTGQPGYSAVIEEETLCFQMDGVARRQAWQMFETTDANGSTIVAIEQQVARPQVVEGGSAISHETYFAPRSIFPESFLVWSKFLAIMEKEKQVDFVLRSKIYKGKVLTTSCRVLVNPGLINALKDKGWSAPACIGVKERIGTKCLELNEPHAH